MARAVVTIAVARTIRSDLANMSVVTNLPVTTVLGAGAWGTALASLLAAKGVSTRIWAREPEVAADIGIRHENRRFLAGFDLPAELEATSDIALALRDADVVVNAVPTQHMRSVLEPVSRVLVAAGSIISVSKGIEMGTLATPHQILGEMGVVADKVVALSGPSFADEVAAGEPTAVTVAGVGATCVRQARDLFSTTSFVCIRRLTSSVSNLVVRSRMSWRLPWESLTGSGLGVIPEQRSSPEAWRRSHDWGRRGAVMG